jgi:ComF family protein
LVEAENWDMGSNHAFHVLHRARAVGLAALDLLLPWRCTACGRSADTHKPFCDQCWQSITPWPIDQQHNAPRGNLFPCASSQAAFLYGGPLAEAIRSGKYHGNSYLWPVLGNTLAHALSDGFDPSTVDLVIPVPLHPRRLRQRGFNQAALLASSWARARRLKVDYSALRRHKDTASQANLPAFERRQNVQGAFLAEAVRVTGRRLVLIDDVWTTGATGIACAKALVNGGAAQVHLLTLAGAMP